MMRASRSGTIGIMFHVEFHLMPWRQIHPWDREGKLSHSWFSLSYGYYRIRVGNDDLFNYSEALTNQWRIDNPEGDHHSMVDYQVTRLWEDLLDLVPRVLVPTPAILHPLLQLCPERWIEWRDKALSHPDFLENRNATDQLIHWIERHYLSDIHLTTQTNTMMWRSENTIYIQWDGSSATLDGISAWSCPRGSISLSVEQFLSGMQRFDREFLAAMGQRVVEVTNGWHRPEVSINFDSLKAEQKERSTWYRKALLEANNGQYVEPYTEPVTTLLPHASRLLQAVPLPQTPP